uniref:PlxyGVORF50 protein n=1 Tax=Plutella xylostella granulovirus TaxID=98383 RepID=A0A1B2CSG3_9BBAC|nr:PlxyGVORF50 protein [Plutella xylostella granulovirus]
MSSIKDLYNEIIKTQQDIAVTYQRVAAVENEIKKKLQEHANSNTVDFKLDSVLTQLGATVPLLSKIVDSLKPKLDVPKVDVPKVDDLPKVDDVPKIDVANVDDVPKIDVANVDDVPKVDVDDTKVTDETSNLNEVVVESPKNLVET